jgi:energy-coupling factor transporter ATP-binding protein EcfA2
MYLKTITVQNVGPIAGLHLELPFRDGLPLPLVLVGPNGSGKSTLLSFIVNALIGFKQQAFEQAEVEHERVYRVRSGMFIRRGACWYHARLEFEGGLALEEWVLDRPRKVFEEQVTPLPSEEGWRQVPEDRSNHFLLTPQPHGPHRVLSRPMQKLFEGNVVQFFPSDRFELPDWLNEQSLSVELRFPEPVKFEGQTSRRIFSRALLRPTLEWVKAVMLDSLLGFPVAPTLQLIAGYDLPLSPHALPRGGRDGKIIEVIEKVLARILGADSDMVRFQFSHRNTGTIAANYVRSGREETVPNLLGLSAGQAALFCLFSNVIRDFDLAGVQFNDISDVRGIVILDEADLHLHVDLQYRVLPELMKLFPKVQFIVTAHSPLLVMGMELVFGDGGFQVCELPSGQLIETEAFSEFNHALAAFTRTSAFDQRVLDRIRRAARPVVVTEGKADVIHLQVAWEKLKPGRELPFDIISCGGVSTPKDDRGGADMLRTMLRACCLHLERPALGLFDHDAEGVEQFNSLKADGFVEGLDTIHRRHAKQPVQALLLPVPQARRSFVSRHAKSCYLALEHYYSDSLLKQFGVADDPVVADSSVFSITRNSGRKAKFAAALNELDASEFVNFGPLFDWIAQLLGVQAEETSLPQALGNGDPVLQIPLDLYLSPTVVATSSLGPAGPRRPMFRATTRLLGKSAADFLSNSFGQEWMGFGLYIEPCPSHCW